MIKDKIFYVTNQIINNKILLLLWSIFLIFLIPLAFEGGKNSSIPSWFISLQIFLLPITIICFIIWIFYLAIKDLKESKIKNIIDSCI